MSATIGYQDVVKMVMAAAAQIHATHEYLSKLDSATGDGDHGTTINRVMDVVEQTAKSDVGGKVQALLDKLGWEVMNVDGGSTSPLLGSFFLGMSEAVTADTLDAPAVAAMFTSGLAKLRQQTKAAPGDKTMVDALVPAIEALVAAGKPGGDIAAAMTAAAAAATKGAESTQQMRAKFGRARNLGDRTLGHQDPGATSISYIFKGFAEALAG
jgi:dihydroxyacetone kinase-like protein